MIVVAIIGILAAVAIPGFMQYIRSSKTSEAKTNIKSIGDGALAFFEAEHCFSDTCMAPKSKVYPGSNLDNATYAAVTQSTSVGSNSVVGQKNDPSGTDVVNALKAQQWVNLKFSVSKPFYYKYDYITNSDGTTFTADAEASLNASADSKFELKGTADGLLGNIIEVK